MIISPENFSKALPLAAKFVANEEGFRAKAYRNHPKEPWTIGFGFTYYEDGSPVRPGDTMDKERALRFKQVQVEQRAKAIVALLRKPVSVNQLVALISLHFNIGAEGFRRSTVLRKLNEGRYMEAADAFLMWKRGNTANDLLPRRKRERALFLTP